MIDLARLMRVLRRYGAARARRGSEPREAYDALRRACRFEIGQRVVCRTSRGSGYSEGVVIAYMLMPPSFVVGPGDDRDAAGKDGRPLFGICGHDVERRDADVGERVPWPATPEARQPPARDGARSKALEEAGRVCARLRDGRRRAAWARMMPVGDHVRRCDVVRAALHEAEAGIRALLAAGEPAPAARPPLDAAGEEARP